MTIPQTYILIIVGVLAVVFVLMRKKMQKPLSPLAGLAFAFVLAGVIFSDNRLVGYGLMAVGIAIAVIDIIKAKEKA